MNASGMNLLQRYVVYLPDVTGIVCLLLAVSFSLTSGIPYAPSLAQVTLLYHSAIRRLARVDLKMVKGPK